MVKALKYSLFTLLGVFSLALPAHAANLFAATGSGTLYEDPFGNHGHVMEIVPITTGMTDPHDYSYINSADSGIEIEDIAYVVMAYMPGHGCPVNLRLKYIGGGYATANGSGTDNGDGTCTYNVASVTSGNTAHFSYVEFGAGSTDVYLSGDASNAGSTFSGWTGSYAAPSGGSAFLVLSDAGGYVPPSSLTRVTSTVPVSGATVATSTSFSIGATGNLNPDDNTSSTTVVIRLRNNSGVASNAVVGVGFAGGDQYSGATCPSYLSWFCGAGSTGTQVSIIDRSFSFPINDGAFSVSTTTNLQQIGNYTLSVQITQSSFDVFGFSFGTNVLAATSTSFTVATSTRFDAIQQNVSDQIAALSAGIPPTCSIDFSSVFDISAWGGCISSLFSVAANWLAASLEGNVTDLLQRWPWGYVTRIVVILNAPVADATLPSIAFTLPSNLPGHGTVIDFTPWSDIQSTVSTLAATTTVGTTTPFLANFEYWWNTALYVLFALWVLRRIFAIEGFGTAEEAEQRMGRAGAYAVKEGRKKLFGYVKTRRGTQGQDVHY